MEILESTQTCLLSLTISFQLVIQGTELNQLCLLQKGEKNSSFHFKSKVQATLLAECTCIRVNSSSDRDDAILENDHFLLPSQSRSQGSLYSSVWEGSSPVSLENRPFSRRVQKGRQVQTLSCRNVWHENSMASHLASKRKKGRQVQTLSLSKCVTQEFNGFALSLALTLFRPPGGKSPHPTPLAKKVE